MAKEDKPIFVVNINSNDYLSKDYNFGKKQPIRAVGEELQKRIFNEVEDVGNYFKSSFKKWPNVPAVAKVTLYDKAFAKSHRPDSILSLKSCPIIGTLELGELLISVTPKGIERLKEKIDSSLSTHTGQINLAVIEKIELYKFNYAST